MYFKKLVAISMLFLCSSALLAKEKLPPILFQTNIEDKKYLEIFKTKSQFERVSETDIGLPIGVLVLEHSKSQFSARGFSSGLFSAMAMGMIPVLDDRQYVIKYQLYVQGDVIETFEYGMTASEFRNFWTMPANKYEPADAELLYREQTVSMFLSDLNKSSKFQDIVSEYNLYLRD